MKKQTGLDFITGIINIFITFLGKTWRYTYTDSTEHVPSDSDNVIYIIWHENILPICYYFKNNFKNFKACVIASRSRDGRRISSILHQWGAKIIKGSFERRGMSVVRKSVRELTKGNSIFITPDGPRGPRRIAKKGAAQIAILSKAPVVPVHIIKSNSWRLTSWDKFIIPKPFTKIVLGFGTPIAPENFNTSADSVERFTSRIQEALSRYSLKEDIK